MHPQIILMTAHYTRHPHIHTRIHSHIHTNTHAIQKKLHSQLLRFHRKDGFTLAALSHFTFQLLAFLAGFVGRKRANIQYNFTTRSTLYKHPVCSISSHPSIPDQSQTCSRIITIPTLLCGAPRVGFIRWSMPWRR